MKKRLGLVLCFAGVLTLSMGFAEGNDSQGTQVSAQNQKGPIKINNLDGDRLMVVSVEEQNAVEHSPVQAGFISREDGTRVFFYKGGSTLFNSGLLLVR
ncbi:hypothetical protein [Ectobacillus panaciterrae]|uniref:hypothetical protein n=1 Tax=Ectobacillus panaciterrae TaxID=363872 RepID=UPI00041C8DB9|nr:hypothetical protein [Ectobacillus panaciterrae]